MFLLADLSSMKPNCLVQPDRDDVIVSTVRAGCVLLEVDDDEPLKSTRLTLIRCPEGASNNHGRSLLPQMTSSPLVRLFSDEGNRNLRSLLTTTWHERSGWITAKTKRWAMAEPFRHSEAESVICSVCKMQWSICDSTGSCWAHSAKLPTGQYILLLLISFFFILNDFLETNYLRICWTNFRNLFTKWKRFGYRWSISAFFLIPQGTSHGNQLK